MLAKYDGGAFVVKWRNLYEDVVGLILAPFILAAYALAALGFMALGWIPEVFAFPLLEYAESEKWTRVGEKCRAVSNIWLIFFVFSILSPEDIDEVLEEVRGS